MEKINHDKVLNKHYLTRVKAHGWLESFFLKAPLDSVLDNVRLGGGRKKSNEKRSRVCGFSSILSLLASSNALCVVAIIFSAVSAFCSANNP